MSSKVASLTINKCTDKKIKECEDKGMKSI